MSSQELNSLYHCSYNLQYHLVLVTKYRRKVINKPILEKLEEHFRYLLNERWEAQLLEFNGEPDHVHMLIALNPKIGPSVLVNNLKTVSSRIIRRDFADHIKHFYRKPVFWSRTYCLITCGGAPLSVLKQYIENQKGV